MAKHRVPKIEEFTDGFTFEIHSEGHIIPNTKEEKRGWYTYTMGIDNWRSTIEIMLALEYCNIRVEV